MTRASELPVAAGARLSVIDAAGLPTYSFGNHSLVWWGTVGLMAIEGMLKQEVDPELEVIAV